MIEKVAKAIAKSSGDDLDRLPKSPGPGYQLRLIYERAAKAAIEAMKEPSKVMMLEASKHTIIPDVVWKSMIDTALKE